jgi:hypothetical protein
MLRKLIQVGAIVAMCTGPAAAQQPASAPSNLSIPLNRKAPPTAEEIEKQKASDRAYNAAMQKIPDKKQSSDPWAAIRPNNSPAAKNRQQ